MLTYAYLWMQRLCRHALVRLSVSVCTSVWLSIGLCVHLPVCLYLYICLSAYLYICVRVCVSFFFSQDTGAGLAGSLWKVAQTSLLSIYRLRRRASIAFECRDTPLKIK
jgi:hypothetical protein